jgi:hypothetical protein
VTDISLREYIEQWIRGHEQIHQSEGKAIDAALAAANEKAERHNDLIHASERKEATYITQGQFDASMKPFANFMASQQGVRQGSLDTRSLMVSGLSMLIALTSLVALVASVASHR